MVGLEYGLTDGIQSATDMVESVWCRRDERDSASSAPQHVATRGPGLNVRSQSGKAGLRCGRFTTVALEELRRFPGMREDQGHGDGGA